MKQAMKIEVKGTRAKGRLRMRWMDNIRLDMNKCGLEEQSETPKTGEDEGGW